jgi:hypothetical protein
MSTRDHDIAALEAKRDSLHSVEDRNRITKVLDTSYGKSKDSTMEQARRELTGAIVAGDGAKREKLERDLKNWR